MLAFDPIATAPYQARREADGDRRREIHRRRRRWLRLSWELRALVVFGVREEDAKGQRGAVMP
uniref:Uncharacterized protein n=1 Tax=Arundo donax TaxID=35708 RepID=A0A0A9CGQ7_ARUDO